MLRPPRRRQAAQVGVAVVAEAGYAAIGERLRQRAPNRGRRPVTTGRTTTSTSGSKSRAAIHARRLSPLECPDYHRRPVRKTADSVRGYPGLARTLNENTRFALRASNSNGCDERENAADHEED